MFTQGCWGHTCRTLPMPRHLREGNCRAGSIWEPWTPPLPTPDSEPRSPQTCSLCSQLIHRSISYSTPDETALQKSSGSLL